MSDTPKTHCHTDNPQCPHCGVYQTDAWEWGEDETGETTCGTCERDFSYTRHVEVTWSTSSALACPVCSPHRPGTTSYGRRQECTHCDRRGWILAKEVES